MPDVVPLTTDFFSGSYGRPVVQVTVGQSKPLNVLLDTGSVGLRVTARSLGQTRGIARTARRVSATFGDGSTFSGTLAHAVIHIGRQSTMSAVPFELVSHVDCGPVPECTTGYGGLQIDGILGIGLTGPTQGQPLPNPLLSLPPPYSDGWELSVGTPVTASTSGRLVLGETLVHPTTEFHLQSVSPSARSHHWYDGVLTCWSIGGTNHAFPTVLDSGSVAAQVYSNSLRELAAPHSYPSVMKSNIPVSVSGCHQRSSVISFETDPVLNPVFMRPATKTPLAVLGVQVFYANFISYNITKGLISLAPSPAALTPQS
jgi:hypothetical protein